MPTLEELKSKLEKIKSSAEGKINAALLIKTIVEIENVYRSGKMTEQEKMAFAIEFLEGMVANKANKSYFSNLLSNREEKYRDDLAERLYQEIIVPKFIHLITDKHTPEQIKAIQKEFDAKYMKDLQVAVRKEAQETTTKIKVIMAAYQKGFNETPIGATMPGLKYIELNPTSENLITLPHESKEIEFCETNSIYTEKDISIAEQIKEIKERISSWSNEIPNHDLVNLGQKIDILRVVERPTYKITLQTLYEKRALSKGVMPYKGQNIPPKTLTEDSIIDIWSLTPQLIEVFEEKEDKYIISPSQEIQECRECKGRGEVYCHSCKGARVRECSSCSGRGEVRCTECGGRGENRCDWCGGSGQVDENIGSGRYRKVNCSSCGGRGYITCTECRNGWKNCEYCGGKGETICKTCKGRGMLTCSLCDGEKRVVSFLQLNNTFKPSIKTEIVNSPLLPAEIISGIEQEVGRQICEIVKQQIPQNSIESFENNPHLKTTVSQLLNSISTNYALGQLGSDYRILKQRLSIRLINASEVIYRYENKQYSLWLYGDGNKLFAPVSPISEVCDNYFSSAKDLFEREEYSQAFDLMNKVISINRKKEGATTLHNKIKNRIESQYVLGGFWGGIITIPIIWLFLEHISNSIHVANKAMAFIIGVSACLILGLAIGVIFSTMFSTKIRERKKRFLYPLITTIIIMIFFEFLIYASISPTLKNTKLLQEP